MTVATLLAVSIVAVAPQFAVDIPDDAVMGDGQRVELVPHTDTSAAKVCSGGETLKGIDVSKWQGQINWPKVAADGVKYAFVRVSDGVNSKDARFSENWEGSRAAGIRTGAYQFFRPNQSVKAQADYLISKMGELGPTDLPPVLDVETTSGLSKATMTSRIGEWIDRVEAATGVKPIIYSGSYFWRDNVGSSNWSDYPYWVAHYTNGCPNMPPQWSDWALHQYTDRGSVNGISGNVDTNYFNGSVADLLEFGIASVCGDGTCGGGESTDVCEIDCPPCGSVAADGETIDNGDACFVLEGPAQYWRNESRGHGGDLSWTKSTNGKVFNSVVWDLFLEEPGDFKVEVFIEPGIAGTHKANYQLIHDGVEDVVVVDQVSASGWTDVGTFGFAAGGRQSLRLEDKTGESGKKIVVDAMRITPADGIVEEVYGEQDDGPEPGVARGEATGACSVGDTDRGTGGIWALLGLIGWLRRRRAASVVTGR